MTWWAHRVRIVNAIRAHGKASSRRLAERPGLSTSSGPRQLRASRGRRPQTALLVGLQRGVGIDTSSAVCGRLPLEAHLGCSPGALRRRTQRWERTSREPSRAWAPEGLEPGALRPSLGAVDATFWPRLRRVCMDWARGDLVLAEVAGERTYDTWSG